MSVVQRFDSVPIRHPVVDKQTGFLHVSRVPIARSMVQPYMKADGSVDMEAKLPDEILSDATVQSANNKPVTNDHPDGLVTKENSTQLMKGLTDSNAHVEGKYLFNDLTITDAKTINDIQNGKKELSIGFETEVVPQQGELDGVKYDSVQRNIRINHVAIVNQGRAGHTVRLLGDSAQSINPKQTKGVQMDYTKVRLDGSDIAVATTDADKVTKLDADAAALQKQVDQLTKENADLKAQLQKLQGNSDANQKSANNAQAKADAAEKELQELKDSINRAKVFDKAKKMLGDSADDFKDKSAKDIKVAAIKKFDSDADLDGKSDDYIDGMFETAIKADSNAGVVGPTKRDLHTDSMDNVAMKLRNERYNLANKGGKN